MVMTTACRSDRPNFQPRKPVAKHEVFICGENQHALLFRQSPRPWPITVPDAQRSAMAAKPWRSSLPGLWSGPVAGVQGFEPQLPDPESGVLPLDDTPPAET